MTSSDRHVLAPTGPPERGAGTRLVLPLSGSRDAAASPAELVVRVYRERADVERIAPAWDALADRAGQAAFSRPSWALASFDHEPAFDGSRLRVVTVWADGGLVGVGPFAETREAGLSVLRFLGVWLGQPNRLLLAPGHEDAAGLIWHAVRRPGTVLRLRDLDERLGMRSLLAAGWAVRADQRSSCAVIDTSATLDQYLSGAGRRPLRQLLRAAHRRLDGDGLVLQRVHARGYTGIRPLLPLIEAVEGKSEGEWHKRGFHRQLAAGRLPPLLRCAAEHDYLVADVLCAGQRPFAYSLSLVGPGVVTGLLLGHDRAFRPYSPGHLCFAGTYEWAHALGGRPIDLSVGDLPYKHRWATRSYGTVNAIAAPTRTELALVRTGGWLRHQLEKARSEMTRPPTVGPPGTGRGGRLAAAAPGQKVQHDDTQS